MICNQIKNKLVIGIILCFGLISQVQGMQYLRRIVGTNPTVKTHLLQPALKRIGIHQSLNTARYQVPRQSWSKRTISGKSFSSIKNSASHSIYQKIKTSTFGQKIKSWIYTLKSIGQTTTKSHNPLINTEEVESLLHQYFDSSLNKQSITTSEALETIKQILEQEQEKFSNDYFSFYHGCSKKAYFHNYINTKLDELLCGRKSNFLLLRSRNSSFVTPRYFFNKSYIDDWEDREHLLSVNPSLMGNYTDPGECSLQYFIDSISMNDIFHPLNSRQKTIYDKYKFEFEDIYDFINQNMRGGICLQIHIKKDVVDAIAYPSASKGVKQVIALNDGFHDSPSQILHALHHNPDSFHDSYERDALQFRLILTKDLLLNPYDEKVANNVTINAWSFDQTVLAQFHRKVDRLIEKIKLDQIKQSKN